MDVAYYSSVRLARLLIAAFPTPASRKTVSQSDRGVQAFTLFPSTLCRSHPIAEFSACSSILITRDIRHAADSLY